MTRWPGARIAGAVLVVALVLAALALSYSPLVGHDKISVLLPSGVVAIIVGLGVSRLRSWRRGLDILEPPVFVSLWCLGFYILPTVSWALGLSSINPNPVIADDLTHWLSMSCWLTAAGLACVWAGYLAVTRRRRLDFVPPVRFDRTLRIDTAMFLYIAGVIVRFLLYTYGIRGNAGFFRAYFTDGSAGGAFDQLINVAIKCLTAAGPALFFFAMSSPRARLMRRPWIVLILLSEGLLGILSGSRAGVVLNLFFFAAYYRYGRGRYPSWKLVPVGVLLFVLSVPVINQIRSETVDLEAMNPASFLRSFQTASRETIGMRPATIVDDVMAVAFDRQIYVFQMQAAVLRLHPALRPFKGVEQLVFFPLYLVPRALWPDKPALFDAVETTDLYAEETVLVFSSPILPAELYSLAGWPTVLAGMFVFGLIQGLAYKHLVGPGRALNLVLFTMVYFELSHWEGQLSGILATLLRSVPLFWLFLTFILFHRKKPLRHGSNRASATPGPVMGDRT